MLVQKKKKDRNACCPIPRNKKFKIKVLAEGSKGGSIICCLPSSLVFLPYICVCLWCLRFLYYKYIAEFLWFVQCNFSMSNLWFNHIFKDSFTINFQGLEFGMFEWHNLLQRNTFFFAHKYWIWPKNWIFSCRHKRLDQRTLHSWNWPLLIFLYGDKHQEAAGSWSITA